MKIFNKRAIQVHNYTYNEEHVEKCAVGHYLSYGFQLTGKKIDSINTMMVTFSISYLVGNENDLLMSYESFTQFNFENEGLELDTLTLTQFFDEYDEHTYSFLKLYGFKTLSEIKTIMAVDRSSKDDALVAIENLRINNLYEY